MTYFGFHSKNKIKCRRQRDREVGNVDSKEDKENKSVQYYSLYVGPSDIKFNKSHILKVWCFCHSPVRHESGKKGMRVGRDSLPRVNPPLVRYLFDAIQEVENVCWREPALKKRKKENPTKTRVDTNCKNQNMKIRSSGHSRFICPQRNHISHRWKQSQYFVSEGCKPRVNHSIWPGDRFSGHFPAPPLISFLYGTLTYEFTDSISKTRVRSNSALCPSESECSLVFPFVCFCFNIYWMKLSIC